MGGLSETQMLAKPLLSAEIEMQALQERHSLQTYRPHKGLK